MPADKHMCLSKSKQAARLQERLKEAGQLCAKQVRTRAQPILIIVQVQILLKAQRGKCQVGPVLSFATKPQLCVKCA